MASCDAKGGLLLGTERTSHWFLPLWPDLFHQCIPDVGIGMPMEVGGWHAHLLSPKFELCQTATTNRDRYPPCFWLSAKTSCRGAGFQLGCYISLGESLVLLGIGAKAGPR